MTCPYLQKFWFKADCWSFFVFYFALLGQLNFLKKSLPFKKSIKTSDFIQLVIPTPREVAILSSVFCRIGLYAFSYGWKNDEILALRKILLFNQFLLLPVVPELTIKGSSQEFWISEPPPLLCCYHCAYAIKFFRNLDLVQNLPTSHTL